MPFASTRISLQWPPAEPQETTDTLVLTSHNNHFVDIRITKPFGATGTEKDIDWIITGVECPIEGTSKIEFKHEINSHLALNHGEAYDIGDFSTRKDGDRDETGVMTNLATGTIEPYVEVWRSIDPNTSTPENYKREIKEESEASCVVYHLEQDGWLGQMVRIGNFAQGAILDKAKNQLSCVRWFYKSQWDVVFQSGSDVDKIPLGEDREGAEVTSGGIKWVVLESTF
jgi:hypothetical protein